MDRCAGSGPAYNQKLSLQRAEAVKLHLVISGGIDPAKIPSVGKGESAPVTRSEVCKGSKPIVKLIACRQPDRRAQVEVSGTR
jgi:OOP family OmpA-OmpF porin